MRIVQDPRSPRYWHPNASCPAGEFKNPTGAFRANVYTPRLKAARSAAATVRQPTEQPQHLPPPPPPHLDGLHHPVCPNVLRAAGHHRLEEALQRLEVDLPQVQDRAACDGRPSAAWVPRSQPNPTLTSFFTTFFKSGPVPCACTTLSVSVCACGVGGCMGVHVLCRPVRPQGLARARAPIPVGLRSPGLHQGLILHQLRHQGHGLHALHHDALRRALEVARIASLVSRLKSCLFAQNVESGVLTVCGGLAAGSIF